MKTKILLITLIFLLSLLVANSQLLSVEDTVASYRFEEGSGVFCNDSSGNNFDGTLNGSQVFIGSKGNNGTGDFATRFDGINDFCVIPDPMLNLTIPFTISLWVNKTIAGADNFFLYKNIQGTDTNFGMTIDASEQVSVFHRVDGETTRAVITGTTLDTDKWVHIVAIVNGTGSTDAFIYFNATQQPTSAGSSVGVDAPDQDLYIGVDANLDDDFLGDLDEIYIFNFSLSANQITDLFNNGLVPPALNTTNLNVFPSKNPVEILESFVLFANYTNATDGQAIPNATCFANSSIATGGQSGFGRGILGIGELSTLGNAVHTQVNDIFGNNTLRVDIDNIPLGKASYGVNFRFHAHNQTPTDNLRVFATCHNNLTFSNFTFLDQVNSTQAVISTSTGNDTLWGFKNVVLFGTGVASPNCSIVFESINTSIDKHWMIADTTTTFNLNNSFTSNDFGVSYSIRPNADERSPFVDAGFGLDVPSETTMTFNSTSGLYFLDNIRHGRPFDFNDTVVCSADQFENATNFVIMNVEDNVPPIVQIISIEPSIMIVNVSNATIQWTANDPELLVNFINVSFPNGSLVVQTDVKPLILNFSQINVLGNYTVIAFANDTGGLFSLANDTFEVRDIDLTPPVITLISPDNNTRNNTVPLNITFQVTDNFPNDIICTLSNSSILFDIGTFIQGVDGNLTLAEGEIALDQNFPNLDLICFDNTQFNNSAVLSINLTLDTVPPVIFPISVPDGATINNNTVNSINIKGNCTDAPVFRFNITLTDEASNILASFESQTVVDNFITIDENVPIAGFGVGNITQTYQCADPHTKNIIQDYNVKKNKTSNEIKWTTQQQNQFIVRYLKSQSDDINVLAYGSERQGLDRYRFWYNLNRTKGVERTFTFEILSRKPVYYISDSKYDAHFVIGDNWLDFELPSGTATYIVSQNGRGNYEVAVTTTETNLNFNSVGDLNVNTVVTSFLILDIPERVDIFTIGVCPLENLARTIFLIFLVVLAFFIMIIANNMKIGILGALGSFVLLVTSVFFYPCIAIIGFLLTAVAIIMLNFFIYRGLRNFDE